MFEPRKLGGCCREWSHGRSATATFRTERSAESSIGLLEHGRPASVQMVEKTRQAKGYDAGFLKRADIFVLCLIKSRTAT